MAGNSQATAPAAADTASQGADPNRGSTSSTAGARHASDNRPPRPNYEAMMEESLAQELGSDDGGGKSGGKGTKKEDKTGSPKEKAKGKKLDLGDDDDEDGDGGGSAASNRSDDDDEEDELTKAAKAKLKEGDNSEESEDPEGDSTEQEEEQEQEADTDDEDDEEGADKDKAKAKKTVPKGMEDWPEAAVERFQRQDAQVKDLKKQLAIEGITIAPTADSPFAHIEKAEDLEALIGQAKNWKKKCGEIPEGGTVQLSGGKTKELTKEEVQQRLNWAEGILDVDAVSDARERLNFRAENTPWEDAQRLVPDLFDRKSENFKTFAALLNQVPQLRKLNDYEYFVACALKGLKQDGEEKSGEARYVRVEMKDGKPVQSKKKGTGDTPALQKKKPTPAPNDTRTPLRSKTGKADVSGAAQRAAKSRSPEDLKALVAEELAA